MKKIFERTRLMNNTLSVEDGKRISVNNKWQKNYTYVRTKATGNFDDLL